MELVYCVDILRKQFLKDWVAEERVCISLSCRNILAVCKVSDTDCSTQFDQQYDVVVLDIDKPWEPHLVTTTNSQLSHLLWDTTSSKLLLIDVNGYCQVWTMKNHLLNQWSCIGSMSVPGEEVLAVMWFHNGLQLIFDPDKRDKTQYIDKFVRNMRAMPALSQFGGSCAEGWILITASGMVSASVQIGDNDILSASESLTPSHLRLTSADIANTGNGDIMIALSDGQLSSAVQCYVISLELSVRNISIRCKSSASLYMKTQMEYGSKDSPSMRISRVMFMNSDSNDTLFVACGNSGYSYLEVWQLLEQMMPLHKMFAMNTSPDTSHKTHKWMHKATIPHSSTMTSIAGPKLPMTRNLVETTGFMPYIATCYKDGTVQLIHRYTFQVIATSNVDNLCQQVQSMQSQGSSDKKLRLSVQLTAMTQTGSGCGILGVHDNRLYLFRMYNGRDSTMQLSPSSIVLLLEYAMVAGQDWWDIFLAVRQGYIMSVCQSLSENFSKQVHMMQDYVFIRLLSMKMGLFSSYSAGHMKAADYHTRLVLHSIGNVIKEVLKPRNITSQDKSPAEKVSLMCNKHTDGDIDNILASLDMEEFHVDVRKKDKAETSLYSIQPLIQWVSDFCLQLLHSAPIFQSRSSFPGSTLLSDASVLNLLRELLVIFKIWGAIFPGCQPHFTTTSINIDITKHLFKLLTRAWLSNKEGQRIEYDDTLLDECSVLSSKVLIPSESQSFRMDSYGFTVFTQVLPLVFKFHEIPDYLHQKKLTDMQQNLDSGSHCQQHHDIVRQMHLGTKISADTRQCTRCGCLSHLNTLGKTHIMKSWEHRWARSCLCMGHWKLVKI